jgi:uncharacterized membrane protein
MKHDKRRRIGIAQVLAVAVTALALFGIWITARATWVIAHGGDTSFQGTFNYPSWSTVHFVPALVFALILPFQLWPDLRRLYPQLHRRAGRVASLAGVLFSVTGLILPFVMPARPFGERAFMTTVSSLFAILLACGVRAARRKDFVAHRQWMLRVTAGALSPLTQRVILPFFAAAGIDSLPRFWDLFLTAAWSATALNFVVAEWWIRRAAASPAEARTLGRRIGSDVQFGHVASHYLPGAAASHDWCEQAKRVHLLTFLPLPNKDGR